MAISFPTVSGTACVHATGTITVPVAMSIYFWYRAQNESAFSSFGYLSPGTGDGFDLFFAGGGTDAIRFQRDYTGTDGEWRLNAADYGVLPSQAAWRWFGISHDGGTGAPTIYHSSLDDATPTSRTVTTTTAPTGTVVEHASSQLHIGNWQGHDGAVNGVMANFGLHGAALDATEMAQAMWSGPPANTLIYASRLDRVASSEDLSGNGRVLSVNGTVWQADGPPDVWGAPAPVNPTRPLVGAA